MTWNGQRAKRAHFVCEDTFLCQGAQRILWPTTASVVRFVLALAAMVLVLRGYASLRTAFVLVAVGTVVATTSSLLGFLRTRWDR
ncbi:hypothetical protein ADM96_31940 [Burkholderia sp. ST111]|nr:hypothetical protein ADM96_31940 [Burkholderia sp. ST111]